MAHDAFISYASEDKPTADAVCAVLEGKGVRCWIAPRDILPGSDWSAAIVDAIEGCRVFVLVFSERANASRQVIREVERAVNKGLTILPFRIEDVVPARSLEYFLGTPHWLDAMSPPLERHLDYLAETVTFLLERGERPPPPVPVPAPPAPLTIDRRMLLAAGGGGAVVLLGAVFGLGLLNGGGGDDGGGGSSDGDGGGSVSGVIPELVGAWNLDSGFSNAQDGSTLDWRVVINKDTTYTADLVFRDAGRATYDPSYFWLTLFPASAPNGTQRSVEWRQSGDTAQALTAALMPSTMLQVVSLSVQPAALSTMLNAREELRRTGTGQGLVGVWERESKYGVSTWKLSFELIADGRYTFAGSLRDSGRVTAKDGRWRQVSDAAGIVEGDYEMLDRDRFIFKNDSSTPFTSQVTWRRDTTAGR